MADLFTIDEMIVEVRDIQKRVDATIAMMTDIIITRDRMFKEEATSTQEIIVALDIKLADISAILTDIANGATGDLETLDLTKYAFEFRTGSPSSWFFTDIESLVLNGSIGDGSKIVSRKVDGISKPLTPAFSTLLQTSDIIEIYDAEDLSILGIYSLGATVGSGDFELQEEIFPFNLTIVDVSTADPGVVTTLRPHKLNNGDRIWIRGLSGAVQANNTTDPWIVASATEYTFALNTVAGGTVNVTSAYASGGGVAEDIPSQDGDQRFKFRVRTS